MSGLRFFGEEDGIFVVLLVEFLRAGTVARFIFCLSFALGRSISWFARKEHFPRIDVASTHLLCFCTSIS
jgi:uncharacterized membrane protein